MARPGGFEHHPLMETRLGAYRITGELGRGGMGVVYRAVDASSREVAIKLLAQATPGQRQRFQVEAAALERLRHPNIVAVREAALDPSGPFLVMDLVRGETLHERVRRSGPLEPREAAAMAQALAEALHYAHTCRILHRDVKPHNVLVAADGRPSLTDFGLAKDLDTSVSGLSQSGVSLGTPGFWPPEQAAGDRRALGPASDVYGLGATLYFALTGEPPQRARGGALEAVAAALAPPEPPARDGRPIDPKLTAICMRCLATSPGDRYPRAAELAHELTRYVDGGRARPARPTAPPRVRSSGAPALAAGAIVVLAGVAAAWLLASAGPAAPPGSGASSPPPPAAPLGAASSATPRSIRTEAKRHHDRAEALFQKRHYEDALRELDQAIALDDTYVAALQARGFLRQVLGDTEAALADWDRVVTLEPDNVLALGNHAALLIERDRLDAAREELTRARRLDPEVARTHYVWAYLHRREGDLDAALGAIDRALALTDEGEGDRQNFTRLRDELLAQRETGDPPADDGLPAAAAFHYRRAKELYQTDMREALRHLDEVVELAPGFVPARSDRGSLRATLGDRRGALEDLEWVVDADPRDRAALHNLGNLRADAGEYEEALELYTRSIEADPQAASTALASRAQILGELGRFDEAFADVERAIEVAPTPAARQLAEAIRRRLLQEQR